MDKYELNLKIDQIKKLAERKAYKEAAKIADEINWVKVKDWSILATVINVQEAVGNLEEARDAAIIAYNRNLGGKKLVYKLTEILIKLKQFDDADELYDEYDRIAYRDSDRYVLYYELRKAEGAEDSELISILDEYREQEADEKYLYELAGLFAKNDKREEAIQICDDVVMWFQDGEYVENCIKLKKKLGGTLTKLQQNVMAESNKRKNDEEETKEILFEKQKEIIRINDNELDQVLEEDLSEEVLDIMAAEAAALASYDESSDKKEDEADDETSVANPDEDIDEVPEDIFDAVSVDANKIVRESKIVKKVSDSESDYIDVFDDLSDSSEKADAKSSGSIVVDEETMNQIPENIQNMFEDAKRQIDSKYDEINKESEQERKEQEKQEMLRMLQEREDALAKDVSVPNYDNNLYNTQNIQEILAQNFSRVIDGEDDEDDINLDGMIPSPNKEMPQAEIKEESKTDDDGDEQIEGQMNLAEWLENVREEKYGKQDTKQYSRSEVVRLLEDRDEKSAAYDKLIEEQKAAKEAQEARAEESITEEEIRRRTEMMLNAAKTDLAIRTGKATLKLEEAVANLKEVALAMKQQSEREAVQEMIRQVAASDEQIDEEVKEEVKVEAVTDYAEDYEADAEEPYVEQSKNVEFVTEVEEEVTATTDELSEIKLETATFETVTDDVIASIVKREELIDPIEDIKPEKTKESNKLAEKKNKLKLNNPVLKGQVVIRDGEKKLTGDLAKLFRKYREMPGIEAQLIEYFENIDDEMNMTTSECGNLIISGNSSSDKIDLARTIVRAINFLYPDKTKKIAKTTGDSINSRGIEKAMPKLAGTALIVEDAGSIQPKRVKEILSCLKNETDRMIVIFEDSDAEMNVLLNFNPEVINTFNHRIVLKQYNVNELVEIARKYANKKQYEIDDDALLTLYLKIDSLHNSVESIRLDDIKEMINIAIDNAVARESKRKFSLLRRSSKNGMNYILPQDLQ